MCPRGHFICTHCKGKREHEGKHECPTCKEPLGEIKSLLATLVIENVKHECDLKGCTEKIYHSEYKKHQNMCNYRLVRCPGGEAFCKEIMGFNDVEEHIKNCKGNSGLKCSKIETSVVRSAGTISQNIESTWKSERILNEHPFFFRMRRQNNIYQSEVVMLALEEDCAKYSCEISVRPFNYETGAPVFTTIYQPRPISTEKWGTFLMTVPEEALAKTWKYEETNKQYLFKYAVKIKNM